MGFFKYYGFAATNINALAGLLDWNYSLSLLKILLPIGLSFHTFQALSYTIEVYFGRHKAERHFGIYALYVMFYPQLVAGPIERPGHLLPQLHLEHNFDYARVVSGLRLMLWGFFKKVVIADRVALAVSVAYANPFAHHAPFLLAAIALFAVELYCDFSGYTDIARGAARVMGFELMENFNYPYAAKSVAEFWRRWHISLSTWLRDYVFFPLARKYGNTKAWIYLSILITFLLSGLWHGAGWTYVAMGAFFGVFIVLGEMTKSLRDGIVRFFRLDKIPSIHGLFQTAITFVLVCFAWIFFRAPSLHTAQLLIKRIFTDIPSFWHYEILRQSVNELTGALLYQGLFISFFSIAFLEFIQYVHRNNWPKADWAYWPRYARWGGTYALILSILFLGYFSYHPFIYFQF